MASVHRSAHPASSPNRNQPAARCICVIRARSGEAETPAPGLVLIFSRWRVGIKSRNQDRRLLHAPHDRRPES